MSVTLTGTGGLFTRLGTVASALNCLNGALGATAPASATTWGSGGTNINALQTSMTKIEAQFASTNYQLIDSLFTNRDKIRAAASTYRSYLKSLAEQILITQVNDDVTLTSKTVLRAITALILQMQSAADYIPANTVSVATANGPNGTPTGNGVCIASLVEPRKGLTQQYPFAEAIDLFCTVDSAGGATAGKESFSFAGDASQTDVLAHDWPIGSGCSGTFQAVSATDDAQSSGNVLVNGDFETFTVTDTPTYWAIGTGTASTDIFAAGSGFAGSNALKFLGTAGAPLSTIRQTFNDASGSTATLKPNTVYAVNCWMKVSDNAATGVVKLDLVNSSNTVIADAASTDNTISTTIDNLTTSYSAVSGFFRTPAQLPTSYKFQIRLTTALNNTYSLFIDHLTMSEARRTYKGGPYIQVCSGGTNFAAGSGGIVADSFAVTTSQNWGSAWAIALQRLFNLNDLELQFLTTGGGTSIADTLIESV